MSNKTSLFFKLDVEDLNKFYHHKIYSNFFICAGPRLVFELQLALQIIASIRL